MRRRYLGEAAERRNAKMKMYGTRNGTVWRLGLHEMSRKHGGLAGCPEVNNEAELFILCGGVAQYLIRLELQLIKEDHVIETQNLIFKSLLAEFSTKIREVEKTSVSLSLLDRKACNLCALLQEQDIFDLVRNFYDPQAHKVFQNRNKNIKIIE